MTRILNALHPDYQPPPLKIRKKDLSATAIKKVVELNRLAMPAESMQRATELLLEIIGHYEGRLAVARYREQHRALALSVAVEEGRRQVPRHIERRNAKTAQSAAERRLKVFGFAIDYMDRHRNRREAPTQSEIAEAAEKKFGIKFDTCRAYLKQPRQRRKK